VTDLSSPRPDALLADLGWLRELARSLARDPALADDIAQETCLLALRHAPPQSWRSWCATVLTNLLRQHHRTERRRRARDQVAAATESLPAADELVARAQAQRDLTARVLGLAEPYRATILLRFYEHLPPREIAALTGVPVATVQSRLTRGLRMLRSQLEQQHGRGWLAALLPLAVPIAPTSLAITGLAMQTKSILAAALVAGISLSAYAWLRSDDTTAHEDPAAARRAAPTGSAGGNHSGGGDARTSSGVVPRRDAITTAPASTPAEVAPRTVRGRAFHVDGNPAAGLALAPRGRDVELVRTGGGGAFEFTTTERSLRLVALDAGLVTLCAAACEATSAREPIAIVAPAVRCGGRTVDEHGRPLANAYVRLEVPAQWANSLPFALEATERVAFTAHTDRDGRFGFAAAPAVTGATLRAVLDGYASAVVTAPALSRDDVELMLRRPTAPLQSQLRGRVLTPEGDGAAAARVALGLTTALADERGFFTLDLARAVTAEQLRAVKAGYQVGALDRPQTGTDGPRDGWPEYVEIRLGPVALQLGGTVSDLTGRPVPDARVWLADAMWFGVVGQMPLQGEGLAAGASIPPQALESEAHMPDADGDEFNDYRMTKPPSLACWPYVVTDRNGRFTLPGLAARDYTLRVLDPASLQMTTSGPHSAGLADVQIRMPTADVFERLRGRVVHRGRPIAGAKVAVRCTPFDVRARVFGGSVDLRFEYPGGNARTDADGRFELTRVPKVGCHLVVLGDSIAPRDQPIDAQTPADDLTIEVDARYSVQVKLRAPLDRADHVAAVDERGERVDLLVLAAGSTNAYSEMPLHDGKSQVFSLSSRARRIVLLKAGAAVGSVELVFQPDRVTEVEG
jgi:RNA polymerase sigma-70 factor (ECF subfamily)